MATKTIGSCGVCGYPLAAEVEGQQVTCPMCSSINEAIAQEGITIPGTLFWSLIAFGVGVILGPALIASTAEGRRWLEEQARGAIRR